MKIKYLITILCSLYSLFCFSQAGQWTWMKGENGPSISTGTYGTQGVASATNNPPSLYAGVYWTDLDGNFWIFGGVNMQNSGVYNDLWKYDVTTNLWTWMKGPGGIENEPGIYGTKGIPSVLNNPGSRGWGVCAWTDTLGDLWMYSGFGYDAMDMQSGLTDLWRYHIATNEWTWMKGDSLANQLGNYGVQTIESSTNLPPDRNETNAFWVDKTGNLWLFGGSTIGGGFAFGNLNDLWKYNVSTNNFVWMKGSNLTDQPSTYGTLAIPDIANTPGARAPYTRSVDVNGDLWLFGGGFAGVDVWKYTLDNNEWTWMDGDTLEFTFQYGTMCDSSQLNHPGAVIENRACWADRCGNFINFGGFDHNDLWFYDITNLRWQWIGGENTLYSIGNYGSTGVMAPTNQVPNRGGTCNFTDKGGNLWLYGGLDVNIFNSYNDLWKYTITDSSCIPNNCFKEKPPKPEPPVPPVIPELFIPNVFSPNGDLTNNLFAINASGFKTYHINIFNRWGQQVFESNDSQVHWNGKLKNNNDASDGTYYYILNLTDFTDEQTVRKGFLTLIR